MKKTCKDCIWYDKCREEEVCEDYSPIDDTAEQEAYYEKTLRERHEDYMEVVEEYR